VKLREHHITEVFFGPAGYRGVALVAYGAARGGQTLAKAQAGCDAGCLRYSVYRGPPKPGAKEAVFCTPAEIETFLIP